MVIAAIGSRNEYFLIGFFSKRQICIFARTISCLASWLKWQARQVCQDYLASLRGSLDKSAWPT